MGAFKFQIWVNNLQGEHIKEKEIINYFFSVKKQVKLVMKNSNEETAHDPSILSRSGSKSQILWWFIIHVGRWWQYVNMREKPVHSLYRMFSQLKEFFRKFIQFLLNIWITKGIAKTLLWEKLRLNWIKIMINWCIHSFTWFKGTKYNT